jgi:hypothetical protein
MCTETDSRAQTPIPDHPFVTTITTTFVTTITMIRVSDEWVTADTCGQDRTTSSRDLSFRVLFTSCKLFTHASGWNA